MVAAGGDEVLLRRHDPDDYWRIAAEHDATWMNLAPLRVAALAA